MSLALSQRPANNTKLSSKVNRILYIKNLPFKITADEMYDLFGKYGALRQIRLGNTQKTRGTAYVVYEDIYDAKQACEHLQGFNVAGRYLITLFFQPSHQSQRADLVKEEQRVEQLRRQFQTMQNKHPADIDDEM